MNEKIKQSKEIIVDRIYTLLTSGKDMTAETFIGIANIIVKLDKHEHKTDNEVI